MTIEFLTSADNAPFTGALLLMAATTVLQVISAISGGWLVSAIEDLIPDIHGADLSHSGAGWSLFGWLHLGKVPFLVLMIVFLTAFGLCGLILQKLAVTVIVGTTLPWWMMTIPAFCGGLFAVRVGGSFLHSWLPQDESSAISKDSFVGRVATVMQGTATVGVPAEARFVDEHGQNHYVMVEPDNPEEQFGPKCPVLIVRREGHLFRVIAARNPALIKEEEAKGA
jgi:hypothetical protein